MTNKDTHNTRRKKMEYIERKALGDLTAFDNQGERYNVYTDI